MCQHLHLQSMLDVISNSEQEIAIKRTVHHANDHKKLRTTPSTPIDFKNFLYFKAAWSGLLAVISFYQLIFYTDQYF